MPAEFDYPLGTDFWVPREQSPPQRSRTAHNFQVVARLADGVDLRTARTELGALSRALKAAYGDETWMFDAAAVPIPYNHHNVDSDEMMFYVGGDYTARRGSGIGIGSISLHPAGFTHGPQPGAVEAAVDGLARGVTTTSETAVMIDTFRPLLLGPAAARAEDPEYAWTWSRPPVARPSQ